MGEPITPEPCDPICCYPTLVSGLSGPNFYGWPDGSCGPEGEQWAWWKKYGFQYLYDYTGGTPPCLLYCVMHANSIYSCYCDGYTVNMQMNFICIGQSNSSEETFGAQKIMVTQGLGPLPNLLNEQHRTGNDEWIGIRDGKNIVKVLFKRDISQE